MEYCRIQWASRNLTRIIYGDITSFGLKEINFSLPVDFEITNDPKSYFNMNDTKELLMFNYQGHLVDNAHNSLLRFNNSQYLISNWHNPDSIAVRFSISPRQASSLASYAIRIVESLRSIDSNAELSYFRGILSVTQPSSRSKACCSR